MRSERNPRRCPASRLTAAILALAVPLSSSLAETLYRWTDDEGRVHYTDSIPPEYARQGRDVIDPRGFRVDEVAPAKTDEQIRREAELERLRAEKERLIQEQRAADELLLKMYSSEEEIQMTRDGKIAALDGLSEIARANIQRLRFQLEKMQKEAANRERSGQGVPKNLLDRIETARQKIKQAFESIIEREQQKQEIRAQFAADLERFRTVKKLARPEEPEDDPGRDAASVLQTVVRCTDADDCDRAWIRAEAYVRRHATTRIQMLGRSIIATAAPREDEDISLAVSRIPRRGRSGAEIFLDVQCKDSPLGEEFCRGERVEAVRSGFRSYLAAEARPTS
jgi:hypothetical protein